MKNLDKLPRFHIIAEYSERLLRSSMTYVEFDVRKSCIRATNGHVIAVFPFQREDFFDDDESINEKFYLYHEDYKHLVSPKVKSAKIMTDNLEWYLITKDKQGKARKIKLELKIETSFNDKIYPYPDISGAIPEESDNPIYLKVNADLLKQIQDATTTTFDVNNIRKGDKAQGIILRISRNTMKPIEVLPSWMDVVFVDTPEKKSYGIVMPMRYRIIEHLPDKSEGSVMYYENFANKVNELKKFKKGLKK